MIVSGIVWGYSLLFCMLLFYVVYLRYINKKIIEIFSVEFSNYFFAFHETLIFVIFMLIGLYIGR